MAELDKLTKEQEAFEKTVGKQDWYGRDLEVKSGSVIDPGQGRELVIRQFEYSKNPAFKGHLTKQELFNMHWRQMQITLWGDGLVPFEDIEPRVILGKKGYKIFITCKPRLRTVIVDKPLNLKDIIGG